MSVVTLSSSSIIPWFSVEARRKIRGALWTNRLNIPYGPRPNQDSNILAMDYYFDFDSSTRARMRASYKSQGNCTHAALGPPSDPGYHGQYPATDWSTDPDKYASILEELLLDDIIIVMFLSPAGWSLQQLIDTYDKMFRSNRWQKICQMIVPNGWEPSEDTPNSQYVEFLKYGTETFPKALSYLHLASDFDAPGNGADLTPGLPTYIGNDGCWRNVAPYLHGFLVQNGAYSESPVDDPVLAKNFGDQFDPNVSGSLANRFTHGYAGWPTFSAYGPNTPIDVVNGECTSYNAYWYDLPQSISQAWGNLALSRGAIGAFDGLT